VKIKGLVIVVDGFDKELFYLASMKFLKSFYYKPILSVKPVVTPACAVSLLTGLSPKEHGIIDFYDVNFHVVTARNVHHIYFTDILKLWGYRIGLWKVPMIYPKKYKGFTVWGLEAPILTSNPYINSVLRDINYNAEEIEYFRDDEQYYEIYKKRARMEVDIFKFLVQKYRTDFSFFWLRYSDILSHSLYKRRNDLLVKYYEYLDKLIKELIEELNPELWIALGDHGFAEKKYIISIPKFLIDHGLIKWSNSLQKLTHYIAKKMSADLIIKLGLLRSQGFLSFLNIGSYLIEFFRFQDTKLVGSEESILTIAPYREDIAEFLRKKLHDLITLEKINNSLVIIPGKSIALTKIVLSKPIILNKSKLRIGIHWINTVAVSNHPEVLKLRSITGVRKLLLRALKRKIAKV